MDNLWGFMLQFPIKPLHLTLTLVLLITLVKGSTTSTNKALSHYNLVAEKRLSTSDEREIEREERQKVEKKKHRRDT